MQVKREGKTFGREQMQMMMIISLTFSVTVTTIQNYNFTLKKGSSKKIPINVAPMSL